MTLDARLTSFRIDGYRVIVTRRKGQIRLVFIGRNGARVRGLKRKEGE